MIPRLLIYVPGSNLYSDKARTIDHVQRQHYTDAKLLVPPVRLPRVMSESFEPIIVPLWKRKIDSSTLAALRDTLIPKLISDELRVKHAERFVEGATA